MSYWINQNLTHLERCRKQLGLSQENLSQLSGVAQSTISRIESGKIMPGLHTLMILADVMGISVHELIKDGGK